MSAQIQFNLPLARQARDRGKAKVAGKNEEFLWLVRWYAREHCRKHGSVTADEVRAFAATNGLQPTHYNVYGTVFDRREFEPGEFVVSKQVRGHCNRIRVYRLRTHVHRKRRERNERPVRN